MLQKNCEPLQDSNLESSELTGEDADHQTTTTETNSYLPISLAAI